MPMLTLERDRKTSPARLGKIALGAVWLAVGIAVVAVFVGPSIQRSIENGTATSAPSLIGSMLAGPRSCLECGGQYGEGDVQGVPCLECVDCGFKLIPKKQIRRSSAIVL